MKTKPIFIILLAIMLVSIVTGADQANLPQYTSPQEALFKLATGLKGYKITIQTGKQLKDWDGKKESIINILKIIISDRLSAEITYKDGFLVKDTQFNQQSAAWSLDYALKHIDYLINRQCYLDIPDLLKGNIIQFETLHKQINRPAETSYWTSGQKIDNTFRIMVTQDLVYEIENKDSIFEISQIIGQQKNKLTTVPDCDTLKTWLKTNAVPKRSETDLKDWPSDVPKPAWHNDAIEKIVLEKKWFKGYPDGTFQGQRPISRYEVAVIMERMLKEVNINTKSCDQDFKDTKKDHWACNATKTAVDNGMMTLTGDKFNGDIAAQRVEVAIAIEKYLKLLNSNKDKFSNTYNKFQYTLHQRTKTHSDAKDWKNGKEALSFAYQTGIMVGYPNGTMKPYQPITRYEFANVLYRLLLVLEGTDDPGQYGLGQENRGTTKSEAPTKKPTTDTRTGEAFKLQYMKLRTKDNRFEINAKNKDQMVRGYYVQPHEWQGAGEVMNLYVNAVEDTVFSIFGKEGKFLSLFSHGDTRINHYYIGKSDRDKPYTTNLLFAQSKDVPFSITNGPIKITANVLALFYDKSITQIIATQNNDNYIYESDYKIKPINNNDRLIITTNPNINIDEISEKDTDFYITIVHAQTKEIIYINHGNGEIRVDCKNPSNAYEITTIKDAKILHTILYVDNQKKNEETCQERDLKKPLYINDENINLRQTSTDSKVTQNQPNPEKLKRPIKIYLRYDNDNVKKFLEDITLPQYPTDTIKVISKKQDPGIPQEQYTRDTDLYLIIDVEFQDKDTDAIYSEKDGSGKEFFKSMKIPGTEEKNKDSQEVLFKVRNEEPHKTKFKNKLKNALTEYIIKHEKPRIALSVQAKGLPPETQVEVGRLITKLNNEFLNNIPAQLQDTISALKKVSDAPAGLIVEVADTDEDTITIESGMDHQSIALTEEFKETLGLPIPGGIQQSTGPERLQTPHIKLLVTKKTLPIVTDHIKESYLDDLNKEILEMENEKTIAIWEDPDGESKIFITQDLARPKTAEIKIEAPGLSEPAKYQVELSNKEFYTREDFRPGLSQEPYAPSDSPKSQPQLPESLLPDVNKALEAYESTKKITETSTKPATTQATPSATECNYKNKYKCYQGDVYYCDYQGKKSILSPGNNHPCDSNKICNAVDNANNPDLGWVDKNSIACIFKQPI